ncbi:phosphate transport system permease protein [Trichlorobacter thiogenes]|uniref:Phosphate transport system permease protein n=1 Tax=Trichlorobacter thiogenes TaxID=115783 RepID=A0A1T4MDA3_9BACT|nr:ABC transporter permease subunit [Trichlorobacter thiogenes]SJZ64913.1 phosphate transport system permease protein [Trichlorobacter thiogenes]
MASSIVDKSRRNDRLAAWLIKAGGLFVIVAVIGILLLIANVALPLFYSPSAEKLADVPAELQSLVASDASGTHQTRELGEKGNISVRLLPDNRIDVQRKMIEKDLLGNEKVSQQSYQLSDSLPGAISAVWLGRKGQNLYAATANGWLVRWDLADEGQGRLVETVEAFKDHRKITALTTLLGDTSLAVGDAKGQITTWMPVRKPGSGEDKQLTLIHHLPGFMQPVQRLVASPRDKSLAAFDAAGTIKLLHMTSERLLLELKAGSGVAAAAFADNGRKLVVAGSDGKVSVWKLSIPHPEVSFSTLFGKVWYEGYDKPEYVWQSSAATDDFEAKISLMPLIFGTFKATLFAMLFAVPLALLGALYTSQFMSSTLKGRIKPAVEIMAAVPSVVIGFLAGLWLAPLMDKNLLMLFLAVVIVPAMLLIAVFSWKAVADTAVGRRLKGYEFICMMPVVLLGLWLSGLIAPPLEATLFGADLKQWLYSSLGVRYDQRNSIIIAIALGFAVIPIIFTIAEDALSNVPRNLAAASLALGASRWQTAWRVILPSALPGVFSAIMIGFGRAVGETMIVLMATGNTPIMSWSLFNGLRSLSANIAVEIPEAPLFGTLYRTLFLSAVLLFVLTFIINTAAELLRQRFRKKYGRY